MAKKLARTFIAVTNQTGRSPRTARRTLRAQPCATKRRLRIGAKNEKRARKLAKELVGNGASVNAIWEVTPGDGRGPLLPCGTVVDDLARASPGAGD